MISVITCSINLSRTEKIKEQVNATIGVEYELIVIDNAKALGGICAAYNQGARQARYDILCFMHDDIAFLTPGWGLRVLAHFRNPVVGLIGLVGSRYKSAALSGWATGMQEMDCCHIFQQDKDGSARRVFLHPGGVAPEPTPAPVPVRTLDGVWLCTRRDIWRQLPFNEQLKGFHFYDLDLCLRISQQYTALAVYDIDLVHFSMGTFANEWISNAIHFHRHINTVPLPAGIAGEHAPQKAEQRVCAYWLNRLMKEPIAMQTRLQWIQVTGAWQQPGLWKDIAKLLLYPVKKKFKV